MLVAQISDTHLLSPASDLPAAQLRADCLERCVAAINRESPDAVILTGDTVQHGQADEYGWLRELLAPLQAPLYLVPGNRDDNEELRRAFGDASFLPATGPFLHYAVEDFDTRLVAVDSSQAGERKGRFCEQRQACSSVCGGSASPNQTISGRSTAPHSQRGGNGCNGICRLLPR